MEAPLKRTALYAKHLEANAKMVPFAGYEMPLRYAGDNVEHLAVRQQCGLFDVSHMGEFRAKGPGALPLLQHITSNDVSKMAVGKAQYNCLPTPEGGIVDDLIVYRLAEEDFLIVVNASNVDKDWAWFNQHNTFGAELSNESDTTSLLALSGPKAPAILAHLTDAPFQQLGYYAHCQGTVAGIPNVLIATTGYTGERTFELYVANASAPALWDALLQTGAEYGLQPAGLGARDSLRLEMGYLLYGNDIGPDTNALEAGLGWITKLGKGDFVGKGYLEQLKANGPARKLVIFESLEKGIPRKGLEFKDENGSTVGVVTSGIFSPLLRTGIGMAYVQPHLTEPGTELLLDVRGKLTRCVVRKAPLVPNTSLAQWQASLKA
jgi:aminomethyltransferase